MSVTSVFWRFCATKAQEDLAKYPWPPLEPLVRTLAAALLEAADHAEDLARRVEGLASSRLCSEFATLDAEIVQLRRTVLGYDQKLSLLLDKSRVIELEEELAKRDRKVQALEDHICHAAPLSWCAGGVSAMDEAGDWEKRAYVLLGLAPSAAEPPK